jgi:phosphate uptake regulator
MEFRKLISFGKGSFVVSVPKSWTNKNKLKKGDVLNLEETQEGLMLSSGAVSGNKEESKITITATDKEIGRIKMEIVSAYLNNYDLIEIISKDLKNKIKDIRQLLMDLPGLEILEQTSTRLVVKFLIHIKEISVNSMIRRMDIITRSMIEDTMKCIDGECEADSIHQRDSDVNRLHFLAFRVIRKALSNPRVGSAMGKNAWELQSDKSIVLRIEKVADRQKRIARYLTETRLTKSELSKLKDLFKIIQESYLNVMKANYTKDIELAYSTELNHKSMLDKCDEFLTGHTHCDLEVKGKRKQKCDYRMACAATALIIENLKAMAASIKYIARTIIGGE